MSIEGAEIVTPAGTQTRGDYSRHAFSGTVPEAENGAGSIVKMILADEDTNHLREDADASSTAQAAIQIWRRCDFTG